VGLPGLEHVHQRDRVQQVSLEQRDLVLDRGQPLVAGHAAAPDHAGYFVSLVQQELGQVGAVLAGDPRDKRAFGYMPLPLAA